MKLLLYVTLVVLVATGCSSHQKYTPRQLCFRSLLGCNGGCEAAAFAERRSDGAPLSWDEVAVYLSPGCRACPVTGEKYIITAAGKRPTCPTHGDLLADKDLQSWANAQTNGGWQ